MSLGVAIQLLASSVPDAWSVSNGELPVGLGLFGYSYEEQHERLSHESNIDRVVEEVLYLYNHDCGLGW